MAMRVAPVSQEVLNQLVAPAVRTTEPKDAVLFRRDEPAFGIFVVLKGSVSLRLESVSGTAIIDRTVTPDSIIGLPAALSGGRYSLTAVTLEESELACLNLQALFELIKTDPKVGMEVMHALGDEVHQMRAILASEPPALEAP